MTEHTITVTVSINSPRWLSNYLKLKCKLLQLCGVKDPREILRIDLLKHIKAEVK